MDQRAALGRAGLAPSTLQWWSEAEAIALEKSQTPPISDHLADLGLWLRGTYQRRRDSPLEDFLGGLTLVAD